MTSFAIAVLVFAAGTWAGAILFQSAIVAPSVFAVLDETAARRFLRTLFPRFFRLGLVLSVLSVVAAGFAGTASGWQSRDVVVASTAVLMAVCAAAALGMIPAINAARDRGSAGATRFSALHRLNVGLTVVMLASAIAILCTVGLDAAA